VDTNDRQQFRVSNWVPYNGSDSLRGFFSITIWNVVTLRGCTLFENRAGFRWVALPSQKIIDRDGTRRGFAPMATFTTPAAAEEFRLGALTAIDRWVAEHVAANSGSGGTR
jgi:hypothetical protein